MTAIVLRSAWQIAGRALPKPIAAALSNASCGSNRAGRSRVRGSGLSLAAAVARLHGGELKLEDNHPGLRSTIALPRAGPVVTPVPG